MPAVWSLRLTGRTMAEAHQGKHQRRQEVPEDRSSAVAGLTEAEASRRLRRFGPNELPSKGKRPLFLLLLDQFRSPLILLLIAAAAISMALGEIHDGIAIVLILVLNGITGVIQEYRAEQALEALKEMAAPEALVIRDGSPKKIPARLLVPGDLVILQAGDIVPADMILVEAGGLMVDESALTGESVPVAKSAAPLPAETLSIQDVSRETFSKSGPDDAPFKLFMGTVVTKGRGLGLVAATGASTRFASIARLLEEAGGEMTPLQKRLAALGRQLAAAALVICALVFGAGVLRGLPILDMFITSVSLAVAAVPEALPAVVTISLALGARELARKKALVRNLPAVETLGSVTYICSDKTGTITQNRMRVEQLADEKASLLRGSDRPPEDLLLAMALCNDVSKDGQGRLMGDPTETALVEKALELGADPEPFKKRYPRVAEIPFSSERMRMTTVHRLDGTTLLMLTKGGVESVLSVCSGVDARAVSRMAEEMAEEGLRVLAFASRRLKAAADGHFEPEQYEQEMTFLGLAGLMDPPRPEVPSAIRTCFQAGITPVMITGDHPRTALAIARKIGLAPPDAGPQAVVTGSRLKEIDKAALARLVLSARVYARVEPEQKLALVSALQEKGQAVAMTGDGVNDAPALKQADIGVAMGINGTDVAKQAADMILLDDNFATIVRSVKIGRRIYDNIRKFLKYLLASNAAEILIIFAAPLFGLPMPLLPLHILWINLISDGAPCLALVAEPAEADVMRRPPRPLDENIFAKGVWQHICWMGPFMAAVCLAIQRLGLHTGGHWQTMVFTALALCQLAHVMAIRSDRQSLFSQGLLSNKPLALTVLTTAAIQLAVVYLPSASSFMKVEPLSALELCACFGAAAVTFAAVELEKLFLRKGIIHYRR